jgi:hypothetical protein
MPALRVTSRHTLFSLDEYDAAQPPANYDVSPRREELRDDPPRTDGATQVIQNLPDLVRRLGGPQRR